jgi:hypothetical protein
MFTSAKVALCVAIMLGTASAAQTAAQHPTVRQVGSIVQHQGSTGTSGDDGFAPAPGQSTTAVYFDPNPAPFKAFTYCASVPLGPSISKRVLQGGAQIPRFQRDT